MRLTALLLGSLVMLGVATPAHAYRYNTCTALGSSAPYRQATDALTVYASDSSFPAGEWRDSLDYSIRQHNKNPSNFYYEVASDTDGVALNNGQSETWGSTDQSILQNAPAIAYSYYDCYWLFGLVHNIKEGDVIFDYTSTAANPFEWTTSKTKSAHLSYAGTGRLLPTTAIHEFGHAAGLAHVNTEYNVMGSDYNHVHTNGNTVNAYIGEDTGDGMSFLYGNWAAGPNDTAVVHWRHLGASGEYSTHQRTRMYTSGGVLLPFTTVGGEPRYQVKKGQSVKVEFTYENNGKGTLNDVLVRYYISTNSTISTTDTQIASMTFTTFSRADVSNTLKTVTIPSTLTVNTNYWLGAIINPLSTIAENDRSNNATYISIRVVP